MVDAVEAQRPDWEGYQTAKARKEEDAFGDMFKVVVSDAIEGMRIKSNDEGVLEILKQGSGS
jgi:hypothetical protein